MTTEQTTQANDAVPPETNTDGAEAVDNSAEPKSNPQTDARTDGSDQRDSESIQANVPNFSSLGPSENHGTQSSISRFLDVSVQVSAELGSVKMPIGDLLHLGEGSVLELNRNISEPVDLVAQGVKIGRGEVVVIDDCFAIRIKEIESNKAS